MPRADELGLEVVMLPAWCDVDDAASLARLIADDVDEAPPREPTPYAAPATRAWIERNGLTGRLDIAAQ